jgi:hypothetical protein
MDALSSAIRTIRQRKNDLLSDRIQRVERADRRVNSLLIVMTGLATALLTLLIASLILVTRPGVWPPSPCPRVSATSTALGPRCQPL